MGRAKELAKAAVRRVLPVLPDAMVSRIVAPGERYNPRDLPNLPATPSTATRLFIGPSNMAGQGWQWARAAERLDGVGAVSMSAPKRPGFSFPVDVRVPYYAYRWSPRWNRNLSRSIRDDYTHVLIESARPLFGDALGRSWLDDLRRLQDEGIRVGLIFHGTDIRLPSRHAARSRWSPFHYDMDGQTKHLETVVSAVHDDLSDIDLPVFVSTPDLLVDLPSAHWLPVVVEPAAWASEAAPFSHNRVPVVAHAPSRASLKGSDLIDPILERLESEGLIHYRRISGVPSAEMPSVYREADIVIDQLTLGIYGVAACEAMAAGRIVVSHVSDQVRDQVRTSTGRQLPIVEVNPDTLERTVRDILAAPENYLAVAAAGVEFVQEIHDGRQSAGALGPFLTSH